MSESVEPSSPIDPDHKLDEELAAAPQLTPWRRLALYLGLASVAVGQPLVDLFGNNPELLAATKNANWRAFAFIAMVVCLPALITWCVVIGARRANERLGQILHYSAVFGFVVLLCLLIFRSFGIGTDAIVYPVALAAGGAGVVAVERIIGLRRALQYMAGFAVALPILFVLSRSGEAIRSPDPLVSNASPRSPHPVVVLILDEIGLYSITDETGSIDEERFPGFAEIASTSTWYPNASAASNYTPHAVPAILTGVLPEHDRAPFASSHPRSLFTLLGNAYDMNVYESTTSVCPDSLCGEAVISTPRGFRPLVRDAIVVYGHRLLPDSSRERLPQIDESWGNFGDAEVSDPEPEVSDPESENDGPTDLDRFEAVVKGGPLSQGAVLQSLVQNSGTLTNPTLTVFHGLLPHRPWSATPDGRTYRPTRQPQEGDIVYPENDDWARELYQRYLMQLSYTDVQLSRSIEDLKAAGIWDDAVVVLLGDHGISFEPGVSHRAHDFEGFESTEDIFRVPLFVKFPGQTTGMIDRCAASSLDILPTIARVVGIEPGWAWDGIPLQQCPARGTERTITALSNPWGTSSSVAFREDDLMARVSRYSEWVDPALGVGAYARVGRWGGLVGTVPVAGVTSDLVGGWSINESDLFSMIAPGATEGSQVPAQITGSVVLSRPSPEGLEILITVNGTAVASITELGGLSEGAHIFSAIADTSLLIEPDPKVGLVLVFEDDRIEGVVDRE